MDKMTQQENNGLIIGRNAVAEAIKSGRVIDTLIVAKGERGGSVGQIISRCKEKGIVIKEIDGSVIGNKVNLCDSCKHEYPVCVAGSADVFFGDGEGNDNVCCCALYAPIKCKREVTE